LLKVVIGWLLGKQILRFVCRELLRSTSKNLVVRNAQKCNAMIPPGVPKLNDPSDLSLFEAKELVICASA
jgi:hypothetical protein